jgi:hypothetical protein
MRKQECQQRIAALLTQHGITDFRFQRRAKHPAVVIHHGGVVHLHVFPGTPSDTRSILNTLSDLRHALGLMAPAPVKGNKPARRSRQGPVCCP